MLGENFDKCAGIIEDLNTMLKRARNEGSKNTLFKAMECIEYLAVCLDDAEVELERNGLR